MAVGEWQYVRLIPRPYPGLTADQTIALEALVGVADPQPITAWPADVQTDAIASLDSGVALGCVDNGYDKSALVGTVTARSGALELRLIWTPPT